MATTAPILLVEDDPDDELLTRRAFEKGLIANPIRVARDGAEALELLHGAAPLRPAVVLLDLNLPKVRGLEVLARIRSDARTRRLPVVVLTSSREDADLRESYHRGADSYVCKPMRFEDFVRAMGPLGGDWLRGSEGPSR